MKITNGKFIIFQGIIHPILGISPCAFGKQFSGFANQYFFRISKGLSEFPLLNGQMNYENFAPFYFYDSERENSYWKRAVKAQRSSGSRCIITSIIFELSLIKACFTSSETLCPFDTVRLPSTSRCRSMYIELPSFRVLIL